MTGLMYVWLGTIVASFSMNLGNALKMFKDVADAGYKIDGHGLSNFRKETFPKGRKVTFLSMLMPVFNILLPLRNSIVYNNTRLIIISKFKTMDIVKEMSDSEKEEYAKKPTALNALFITFKSESMGLSNAKINDLQEDFDINDDSKEEGNEVLETTNEKHEVSTRQEQINRLLRLRNDVLDDSKTKQKVKRK